MLPPLIPELLALAGNPSDNIPSVPGIGLKRAAALINQYGDLQRLLAECGAIANRQGEAIREDLDNVVLWHELRCLRKDIQLGINLRDAKVSNRRPGCSFPFVAHTILAIRSFRNYRNKSYGIVVYHGRTRGRGVWLPLPRSLRAFHDAAPEA